MGQLQALGATDVHGYRLVDAIAARVPASALGAITASPGVASVIPDSPITGRPRRRRRQALPRSRRPGRRRAGRHGEDTARRVLGHAAA